MAWGFRRPAGESVRPRRTVETVANIAIVVLAFVVAAAVVRRQFWPHQHPPAQRPVVGSAVRLPAVQWSAQRATVVLALSKGCHFCTESAGFYRRLVVESARRAVPVVAVLPGSGVESRTYLGEIGVQVASVHQADFRALGIRGTPTVLLVGRDGRIIDSWVGRLRPAQEDEVIAALD